ncbi:MAG: electron transfer flavoprotein subunit beta/FixA family protein [Candidatus Undinarchaeales archaeon]|jgi:electron transfer flavoprotein beta subunit|nr:electron transfer flavoprotein subunit beta/FixA family protein [Candidatus Undinarchaeales archaeon]MDP7492020.1 electron transfer flavoprotein subunit beta/FixA family protein [Candidatus Undinarchaeales archaeon]
MKIIVCVKMVPDTTTKIVVAGNGKDIDRSGVEYVLNPYDEYAVEEALSIKERFSGSEVVILSLGPSESTKTIRTALAMGADRGVLLKAESTDPFVVAKALADEISSMDPGLVLLGKQAVDDDANQVGGLVAEFLGLPFVSSIIKLEISEDRAVAQREREGGYDVVEVPLPCVLSAQRGLNEPRYTTMKGIMMSKRKPIEEKEPILSESLLEVTSLHLPPPRSGGKIVGEGKEAVPELVRLLKEEAKIL